MLEIWCLGVILFLDALNLNYPIIASAQPDCINMAESTIDLDYAAGGGLTWYVLISIREWVPFNLANKRENKSLRLGYSGL